MDREHTSPFEAWEYRRPQTSDFELHSSPSHQCGSNLGCPFGNDGQTDVSRALVSYTYFALVLHLVHPLDVRRPSHAAEPLCLADETLFQCQNFVQGAAIVLVINFIGYVGVEIHRGATSICRNSIANLCALCL